MSKPIKVSFSDGETLFINDVIEFDPRQEDELITIATQYTKKQLREEMREGETLSYLTETQKQLIIEHKNRLIHARSAKNVYEDSIVRFTVHTIDRMMERIGSDELHTIINIIERLQMSDIVKKAQFKGYPALTYTLMKEGDSDKYVIPIAFQLVGENRKIIRIITISFKDAPPKALENRLNTDLEMVKKMELFKKRLVEKYNQKKR